MQAVRQCSVCAGRVAGAHLWSQVNVSGLQKNVVSKGACIRFQRYVPNRAGSSLSYKSHVYSKCACNYGNAMALFEMLLCLSYSSSDSVLISSRRSAVQKFAERTAGANMRRVSSWPQDFPLTQVRRPLLQQQHLCITGH